MALWGPRWARPLCAGTVPPAEQPGNCSRKRSCRKETPSLLLPEEMGNQDRVEPRPRAGGRAQRSQGPHPHSTRAALQAWLGCAHLPCGGVGQAAVAAAQRWLSSQEASGLGKTLGSPHTCSSASSDSASPGLRAGAHSPPGWYSPPSQCSQTACRCCHPRMGTGLL